MDFLNSGVKNIMYYEDHFFGMHMLWWLFWLILLFVLFGWFAPVPKKRMSPLDILQKRFAAGEPTTEGYEEKKKILESDAPRDAT